MALWIPIREAGSLDHFRIRISIGNAGCMERDQFTWDRRIGALTSNGNLDRATSCNWQFFFNSINTLDGTWLEDIFLFLYKGSRG